MPRHWRCGNAHDWVGDLGALTYCPVCGSADVYEIRGPLPPSRAPVPAPEDDGPVQSTVIIPAPAPPAAPATDQTWKQSVPDALGQAAPEQTIAHVPAALGKDPKVAAAKSIHDQLTRELPALPQPAPADEPPVSEDDPAPSTWIQETAPSPAPPDTWSSSPGPASPTSIVEPPAGGPAPAADTESDRGTGDPPRGGPRVTGYEILGELGRGGMGVVYKARQQGLNRLVALKMVLSGVYAGSAGQSRFRAEAEAIAALQHPNIVQVYEVGEHDGLPYFSLEYLDGGSLQERLGGRPLPPRDAAAVAEQLARAAQYAHERGIVHRDLKPGNVLFKIADGRLQIEQNQSAISHLQSAIPKITDFGLARRLGTDSHLTDTGTVLGTPSYMAPEQAEGKSHAIGPPADIHALGAILYEMLTGRPPFLGTDPTATVMQVRLLEPVPPRRWQPGVPRDLETITLKCLQKEPHRRYATAGELAEDLARFLRGAPILARPVSLWEKVWKWARRKPATAGLVVLGTVVVLGLGVGGPVVAHRERELRTTADQARAQAELNFRSVRMAVDEFLASFGDEGLRTIPLSEKVRSELVERSLKFYGRFLRDSDDPAVRQEAAWAYQRVGYVRDLFGRRTDAIAAYQKAVELFTRLTAEAPDNADHRRDLADTHRLLGVALEADGRRADADRSHDIARGLLARLVEEFPRRPEYRLRLGKLFNDHGQQLGQRRQLAEAEGQYFAALAEFDRLCAEFPTVAHRLERAKVQSSLGALLLAQNQTEPALAQLRAARDGLIVLVYDPDDRLKRVQELGRTLDHFGAALFRSGQAAEAETQFRSAVERFTDLANDFPKVPEYRFALALALDNLAHVRKATGGLRAAEPERTRARELWAELARESPDNAGHQLRYALSLDEQGIYLEEVAGRRAEALRVVSDALGRLEKLAADDPFDPSLARELARRHLNLGILLTRDHQEAEAEEHYARAGFILENVLVRGTTDDAVRLDLITTHTNRAALMHHLGRTREEEASWRRVARLQELRIDAYPTSPDLAADLARTQFALAGLRRDRPGEQLPALRAAFDRQRSALALAPRRSDLAADVAKYGTALTAALMDEDDHATTAQTIGQLEADLPPTWDGWPRVAGLLCRCMKLARQDTALPADARARIVRAYGDQALGLLRKMVAVGRSDATALRSADDLELLRSGPEFQEAFARLVADAEARSRGGDR